MPFISIAKVRPMIVAFRPNAFRAYSWLSLYHSFIPSKVTTISLLGSFLAAIAPFLADATFTAWTISARVLFRSSSELSILTIISRSALLGMIFAPFDILVVVA